MFHNLKFSPLSPRYHGGHKQFCDIPCFTQSSFFCNHFFTKKKLVNNYLRQGFLSMFCLILYYNEIYNDS